MKPSYINPLLEYNVIDGDTVKVSVDLGYNLFHRVSVRLQGIEAPSMTVPGEAAAAEVVAAAVRDWLAKVDPANLRVESVKFGKYAKRIIGDMLDLSKPDQVEGRLAVWLLREKLVKLYDGGTKPHWTDEELVAVQKKGLQMDRPT